MLVKFFSYNLFLYQPNKCINSLQIIFSFIQYNLLISFDQIFDDIFLKYLHHKNELLSFQSGLYHQFICYQIPV